MFTGGTSWAPAGRRSTPTLPPERPVLRAVVRGVDYGTADRDPGGCRHDGDRHTGYDSTGYDSSRYGAGQLSFRLVDHIVPQRKPLDDDHQLCLDIPVRLGRSARTASSGGEPRHRNIAHRWVSALLETASGRRDRRQLDRLLYRGVDPPLADLAAARRAYRIHSCSPTDEVIYVAAALHLGTRVRALTAELRSDAATAWRYAAIDLI